MNISENVYAPVAGSQNLTLTSTPATLTVPSGAGKCWIYFETGSARWTSDGTTPSATVGMLQEAGSKLESPVDPSKLKLVMASGTPAISVSYFA